MKSDQVSDAGGSQKACSNNEKDWICGWAHSTIEIEWNGMKWNEMAEPTNDKRLMKG